MQALYNRWRYRSDLQVAYVIGRTVGRGRWLALGIGIGLVACWYLCA